MRVRAHPRLVTYTAVAALGLIGALTLGRPALVALVAPFAVWLGIGVVLGGRAAVEGECHPERPQAAENETVDLVARLRTSGCGWLELEPQSRPGLRAVRGALRPRPRAELTCRLPVLGTQWGAYRVGRLAVHAQDLLGLLRVDGWTGQDSVLRIYPAWSKLRRLAPPRRTQVFAGNRVSREGGEGIEFSEVRPFAAGDLVRRINWRVTARTGIPHVNLMHLERNSDVVLFIDSFTDVGSGRDSVLSLAVRAAAALADGHLAQRDRVGVVGFGGLVRWLNPGMGPRHLYRLVDSILDTDVVTSYAWRDLNVIPPRMLPPAAMVIALTPLLDPRSVGAIWDLHRRGFDLLVLEIDPEGMMGAQRRKVDPLALRVFRAERVARRHRLQRAGVAVIEWRAPAPLESVLAASREYRRSARPASA